MRSDTGTVQDLCEQFKRLLHYNAIN